MIKSIILWFFYIYSTTLAIAGNKELLIDDVFKRFNVRGSLLITDEMMDEQFVYDPKELDIASSPASTFKILHTMIALQEKRTRLDEMFAWDGSIGSRSEERQNQTLKTAYQNSIVWVYQNLAQRMGKATYKRYFQYLSFGNQSIDGELTRFWLGNSLKITPRQQLDFLVRVYKKQLPFSKEVYDAMDDIMVDSSVSDQYRTFRAKTGWAVVDSRWSQDMLDSGWWVGYVTYKNQSNPARFFVLRLMEKNQADILIFY
jgi:beta-lactamase class D